MSLIVALCVGVSHKLQTTVSLTFIITSLICRVMLVTLDVAVLLSLICFFFIRHGILGTVRISIFDQGRHQLAHVITITLEPPQLLFQRLKRQFFSNIKTAEPASILSDECIISLPRRTQWVVDTPSSCLN